MVRNDCKSLHGRGMGGGGGGHVQLIKKVKASEHVYSGNFLQKFEFFLHTVPGASYHKDFSCQKLDTSFARTKKTLGS
jgi:hypothetical protein